MKGKPIGLYDVNTGASLDIEKWVDLGVDAHGEPLGLAYTTASHGHLVQIRAGSLRCTYDVNSDMLTEDAERVGRWMGVPGAVALATIRENATS